LCLICGGLGLLSVAVIHNKLLLLLSMTGVGIAWASTLAMPYSILGGSLPEGKTGVYMGIFNSFVVIPEILVSLGFGWIMGHLLGNNRSAAGVGGGRGFLPAGGGADASRGRLARPAQCGCGKVLSAKRGARVKTASRFIRTCEAGERSRVCLPQSV